MHGMAIPVANHSMRLSDCSLITDVIIEFVYVFVALLSLYQN